MLVPVLVFCLILLVLGIIVVSLRATSRAVQLEDQRLARRREFADRHGFEVTDRTPFDIHELAPSLFRHLGPEGVSNVAHGHLQGRRTYAFDIQSSLAWSGMDAGMTYQRYVCVAIELDGHAPKSIVEPRDRLDRLRRLVGRIPDDSSISDSPLLDKFFRLESDDPAWLRAKLGNLCEWLREDAADIRFEITDNYLLVSQAWVPRPAAKQGLGVVGLLFGGAEREPPLGAAFQFYSHILDER